MKFEVSVIGGGLAGCEAALQLARHDVDVRLVEMRPGTMTPAHRTGDLAELVCSNSLKSDDPETASGLLKRELRLLKCELLEMAEECRVPAGHALAVDRELFAKKVTESVARNPRIRIERREQEDMNFSGCTVVATGPLTSPALSQALAEYFGRENLFFYDAISISVSQDSIDNDAGFWGSRYGKGGDDYWNIPLDPDCYRKLVEFLREAPVVEPRDFEEKHCFEACLPVEVMAKRGKDALRYGPLKPKGLVDPRTGKEAHAVLQLRRESMDGTLMGLVGFQTRLTRAAQKELLSILPGFKDASIMRWGAVHRNMFLDSPRLLNEAQMHPDFPGLFLCGQIVGVEGYMESIAHGLVTAHNVIRYLKGLAPVLFPAETMLGALQRHCRDGKEPFQPMNANFGLLPALNSRRGSRKRLYVERSLESMQSFIREYGLFDDY